MHSSEIFRNYSTYIHRKHLNGVSKHKLDTFGIIWMTFCSSFLMSDIHFSCSNPCLIYIIYCMLINFNFHSITSFVPLSPLYKKRRKEEEEIGKEEEEDEEKEEMMMMIKCHP